MQKTNITKLSFIGFAMALGLPLFAQQGQQQVIIPDLKVINIENNIVAPTEKTIEVTFSYKMKDDYYSDRPLLGVTIENAEGGVKLLTVNGAAKEAGLKEGDIITAVGTEKISSVEVLQSTIRSKKAGDNIQISFLRNGQASTANATLKAAIREDYVVERRMHRYNKMETSSNFDPCKKLEELRGEPFIGVYINTDGGQSEISSVIEKTGAARSELKAGDVITKINGETITDYDNLRSVLKKYKPGQVVRIGYSRGDKNDKTRVTLSSMADREERRVKMLEELCDKQQPAKSNEPAKEESKKPEITSSLSLNVFPNPTADIININFAGGSAEQATVTVSGLDGKEVMRLEVNENTDKFTQQLDLSKLPKGFYLVTVKQGKNIISKQVAVK